ncbi:MAG: hypothetical protein ACI9JY_002432, partial [Saprospiraceae bacterium]
EKTGKLSRYLKEQFIERAKNGASNFLAFFAIYFA